MRRQLVHGEKDPPNAIAAMSIRIITETNIRALRKKSASRQSKWSKPKEGFVMINVDASFDAETFSGGIGVVIRDDTGSFIAACNNKIPYAIDAYTLETKAVSRGIALADEIGCSRIIIQSDCSQVIETLQSGFFPSTPAAALFDDIYVQASSFSACEFSFCNREANAVADCLSRETELLPHVWVDDPPTFLVSLLIDDVIDG